MNWIQIVLPWYFTIFTIGVIFFPLTKKIFGKWFLDYGYAFSKTIGILILTYVSFLLGILKIIPFYQSSLVLLCFIFFIGNVFLFLKQKKDRPYYLSTSIVLIVIEELLFFASFLFLTFMRGQEPSLRGLEKFMDFGFMNSILRSTFFPPKDMWLSADPSHPQGYTINYYYFGHMTGATLIKLTNTFPSVGYNLVLATLFAQSISQAFSLISALITNFSSHIKEAGVKSIAFLRLVIVAILGTFIVNLGGNLHTIYLFTSGYPNDNPIPFWKILSGYNPTKYWYPNATRFIPFTIHEFPSYSWVVADLHGHVFDIPFVLLTLSILFIFFLHTISKDRNKDKLPTIIFLGFLAAIHYMTNAFDGPIYLLLTSLFLLYLYRLSFQFFTHIIFLIVSFIIFSLPFSFFFNPFVTGIGVNCSPDFLINIHKIGPFLFEKDKCQSSPLWMLFVLWGFFLINFAMYLFIHYKKGQFQIAPKTISERQSAIDHFILILFSFSTFLLIVPEFFYIKDIYPAHFRANTMFKLGYQSFIMMSLASTFTFFKIKFYPSKISLLLSCIFIFLFCFVAVYPFFAFPSYYGSLNRPVELDGTRWLDITYPEDKEIIQYLNQSVADQPVILEAQGDSYTDFERISAYTGLPTVAGWWVHEWLWRGSSAVVGDRIPDITTIYQSADIAQTKSLLQRYHVQYVIVSSMERKKYPQINELKFSSIGQPVFRSSNNLGVIYRLNI